MKPQLAAQIDDREQVELLALPDLPDIGQPCRAFDQDGIDRQIAIGGVEAGGRET